MIINRTGAIARRCGITAINALAVRTGLDYNTAHALYTGRTTRIDHDSLDRLCAELDAQPGDLFVYVPRGTLISDASS